jgi:putative DNA primase/helicase
LKVPFDNILSHDTETTVDRLLKFRLRDDQEIHKAILAWIVDGCKRWKQEGFKIPDSVRDATDKLFETNDFLSGFFADCCEKAPENTEIIPDLRSAHELWCHEQEIEPAKGKSFNAMLRERGMHQKTDGATNGGGKSTTAPQWHGLSLNQDWKIKAREWKLKVEAWKRNQDDERLRNKLSVVANRRVA